MQAYIFHIVQDQFHFPYRCPRADIGVRTEVIEGAASFLHGTHLLLLIVSVERVEGVRALDILSHKARTLLIGYR